MSVPTYLTTDQVAEIAHVDRITIRRAIATGQLQAFRPGRRYLVREDHAQAWIESRPVSAQARRREPVFVTAPPASPAGNPSTLREMDRAARARG